MDTQRFYEPITKLSIHSNVSKEVVVYKRSNCISYTRRRGKGTKDVCVTEKQTNDLVLL